VTYIPKISLNPASRHILWLFSLK